ncbi:hypothetical protein HNQ07_003904 [Deinococcus metalli]|uniref:Lipoprotein n=1 Tax=Deinococcus metalli TaxID=1141878 RepID=A0A7W8KJP2_9DEIO|nr:hypothetical protein [Deinococcus metalli]MBB5378398.1 hypothetical protein [Deinococcus metalli]GHF59231.1 hypothetical protein GCM10017781_39340 [Deinococcus metalli]
MNRHLRSAALLVLVCALLSACGSSGAGTPTPAAIPGTTLSFALEEGALGNSAWTYGAGTLTLRGLDTTNTSVPGPVIATASVNALGMGSVSLPGSAGGIVAKTNLSPKAAPQVIGDLSSSCLSTVTESAPGTQALLVTGADFASNQGGVALNEVTITPKGSEFVSTRHVPVFVTQDDTVSGSLKCSSKITISLDLPFKKGWNMLLVTVDFAAGTFAFSLDSGTSLHYIPETN